MSDLEPVENLEIEETYITAFKLDKRGVAVDDIAKMLNISRRTVYRYIAKAREQISAEIKTNAKAYTADVFWQYQYVFEKAKESFEQTGDVAFLKELRMVTANMASMLGLNAAPKSAISDEGDEKDASITYELSDDEYKKAEAQFIKDKENAIELEGKVTNVGDN